VLIGQQFTMKYEQLKTMKESANENSLKRKHKHTRKNISEIKIFVSFHFEKS